MLTETKRGIAGSGPSLPSRKALAIDRAQLVDQVISELAQMEKISSSYELSQNHPAFLLGHLRMAIDCVQCAIRHREGERLYHARNFVDCAKMHLKQCGETTRVTLLEREA